MYVSLLNLNITNDADESVKNTTRDLLFPKSINSRSRIDLYYLHPHTILLSVFLQYRVKGTGVVRGE